MRHLFGRPSLFTGCAALVALAACAEIFGPTIALGVYQLTAVNGDPVPFVMYDTTYDDGTRLEFRIEKDSLNFTLQRRVSRVRREGSIRYRPDATRDTGYLVLGQSGSFRGLSSDKIVITYDNLGATPFPWPPDTLTVEADGRLRRSVTFYLPTPRVWTFIYTRP